MGRRRGRVPFTRASRGEDGTGTGPGGIRRTHDRAHRPRTLVDGTPSCPHPRGRDPLMLVLAIDTATPRVAAAIGDDGRVKGGVNLASRRRHAEQLAPPTSYLCEQTQVRLAQLAAVAVGIGPGLFTGLRVGVTT